MIVDQVIAVEKTGNEVNWFLADNLGSIRYVLDDDGNVINEITYDSFGEITNETHPTVDLRFTYTGREEDEETGLHYYRSRYYDSPVGRFINEDTIGFAGGDANLYRYVGNNAVNAIDPYGELAFLAAPVVYKGLTAFSAGVAIYNVQKSKEDFNKRYSGLPPNYFPNPQGYPDREENKLSNNTGHTTKPNVDTNPRPFPDQSDVKPITNTGGSCNANDDFSPPFLTISPYDSQTDTQLYKSKKTYQDLIQEHEQKRENYLANPDAYDNKGKLRNAPPDIRQKIINGRAKRLQNDINKQKDELDKINQELINRGLTP